MASQRWALAVSWGEERRLLRSGAEPLRIDAGVSARFERGCFEVCFPRRAQGSLSRHGTVQSLGQVVASGRAERDQGGWALPLLPGDLLTLALGAAPLTCALVEDRTARRRLRWMTVTGATAGVALAAAAGLWQPAPPAPGGMHGCRCEIGGSRPPEALEGFRSVHEPVVVPPPARKPPDIRVMGALEKEVVQQVFHRHRNEIQYCWEAGLTRFPHLHGTVSVKFVISAEGTVASSHISLSDVGNVELESCMAGRVRTWQFPKPRTGGIVIVTYPIHFDAVELDG